MKPHFGQSDAAMNKLAGINHLPNNNKPADLLKLRNVPCSCVPCKHYEVSLDHGPCVTCRDHAKFEEKDFDPRKERDAAYDLGYKDAVEKCIEAVANVAWRGAFRDGKAFSEYLRAKFSQGGGRKMSKESPFRSLLEMSDKIAREELGDYYVMGASRMRNILNCLDEGAEKIQALTYDVENKKATVTKYCDALHIIAHMGISGLSWQHDYEKCVNIAKEALDAR